MMRESAGGHVGRWAGAYVAIGLLAAGCDPQAHGPTGPLAARDSAGIAIIESDAPKYGVGQGRHVAEQATFDLAGAPAGFIGEAISAARLSDGRIIVADGRPPVLRYISAQGKWLYDVGSAADGKEALGSIFHLAVGPGDTVAVYDLAMRRALLFDQNGSLAAIIPVSESLVPKGSNGFLPHGMAPDGRYLLQRDEVAVPFRGAAGEILPDSTALFWLSRSGKLADSSRRLRAGEIFGFPVQTGRPQPFIAPLARPFGGALRVAVGPSLVWYGEGTRWEFRGLDTHGQVARIIRLVRPSDPLTPAFKDTFVARFQARQSGRDVGIVQKQFAAGIASAPFPDTLPAFTDFFFGRDSTLWVQHAGLLEGVAGDATLDWTVIGADGRWLQEIRMPVGFRPTDAGKDWVLGIWRDERGPAHVRLYPVVEG